MSNIVYSRQKNIWVGHEGGREDIKLYQDAKDYYYAVDSKKIVLRCYNHWCLWDEPLGELLTFDGKKIEDIPPFIHPDYRDIKKYYKSQINWVQDHTNEIVSFVIFCQNPQNFRIKLNLDTLEYSEPEFGVR